MKEALESIAYQIKSLGNGNAGSEIGAIENIGMKIDENSHEFLVMADRFVDIFDRIAYSFESIAETLYKEEI